jgi:hypothetical protein
MIRLMIIDMMVYTVKLGIALAILNYVLPPFLWRVVHAMTAAYISKDQQDKLSKFKQKSNEQEEKE